MTPQESAFLDEVPAALNARPFAATVRVGGVHMPRASARLIESVMMRARVAERRQAA